MPKQGIHFKSYGNAATGLTLTWQSLKKLETGSDFTPQPTFSEVGAGWYRYGVSLNSKLTGFIDGGATLPASERYKEVLLDRDKYTNEVIVVPVYNETSDILTVAALLHRNGQLVTASLTSCSITFYDKTGASLFTVTSSSFINGVAVMTKSVPSFSKNEIYYCVASITCDGEIYTSTDTHVTLE